MKTRIISGIVLFILLVPTFLIGGYFTLAVLAVVSVMGVYELLKVFKSERKTSAYIEYALAVLFYLFLAFKHGNIIEFESSEIVTMFIVMVFLLEMVLFVFKYPEIKIKEVLANVFSFIYVPVLLSFIFRIRAMEDGICLVWMTIITSWICDTCAYFAGVFLGKHKAFPVLSPKKTWEGCTGGVIGSVAFSVIFGLVVNAIASIELSISALVAVAFFGSIISMFGDLAASAIKREYGIKDYSNLIPGHGGILDRFDSVIFVSPVIFYLLLAFVG